MKKEKKSDILLTYLLQNSVKRWINSNELSNVLDVSTRQIRNYISSINTEYSEPVIISSKLGYKVNIHSYNNQTKHEKSEIDRQFFIIQKLISNKKGYSILDFERDLYVSDATIDADIQIIKKKLRNYNINITKKKDIYYIKGQEIDFRNLMNMLMREEAYNGSIINSELLNSNHYNQNIKQEIKLILENNDLYANDYYIDNISIHLIIMIERLLHGFTLVNDNSSFIDKKENNEFLVAKQISNFIEKSYNVIINDSELQQIFLLISTHSTNLNHKKININNISEYIDIKYLKITKSILNEVKEHYYISSFNDSFISNLTIHIWNVFERVNNNYYAKNPLTDKIKNNYPLVYDIAVFIATKLFDDYKIQINEDEIAFISFHIGAYFESRTKNSALLKAIYIYADYYSYQEKIIDTIQTRFGNVMNIENILSYKEFQETDNYDADLIITPLSIKTSIEVVQINPFLKDNDYQYLNNTLYDLKEKKRRREIKSMLFNFFHPSLFYKNPNFKDKFDSLKIMGNNIIKKKFASESFYNDVFLRENLSSTAFNNVAVPHAVTESANRSFISIALLPHSIDWGNMNINMIAYIGISKKDRKLFVEFFEEIIEILNNSYNINILLESLDYNDFISKLYSLLNDV
ncbi:BglG family transcription antiterminator [Breznakia pachnodae]|uniref:Lichenan operon transcriptional antiterminator n=1 Tax=Breznakia pachnodae TaxID=265178 RepID=A0ABU0E7Y1_9FIRM|nr:PRD domain-containing protein [Breznakia pachnodae]MDQ0363016.1 lichenan operon transcriptional antiterminator [Breznakia pachnodae]